MPKQGLRLSGSGTVSDLFSISFPLFVVNGRENKTFRGKSSGMGEGGRGALFVRIHDQTTDVKNICSTVRLPPPHAAMRPQLDFVYPWTIHKLPNNRHLTKLKPDKISLCKSIFKSFLRRTCILLRRIISALATLVKLEKRGIYCFRCFRACS